MCKVIQVVASDVDRGILSGMQPVVLHTWKTAHHHGKKKMRKLMRRINRWARKAQRASDIVWTREVA